jgi:hypothetical protein
LTIGNGVRRRSLMSLLAIMRTELALLLPLSFSILAVAVLSKELQVRRSRF